MAEANKSKSYIQHLLIYARATINEGVKRRLIHYNYANELKVPKRIKKVDQRFLTDDKISKLLLHFRYCGRRRDELILWLFYACAPAPGNCLRSVGMTGMRLILIIGGLTKHSASQVWTTRRRCAVTLSCICRLECTCF